MKRRLWTSIAMAVLVVSCAPFSKEIMRQVDEKLTFQIVRQDPQQYMGKSVLWGGVILETINRQNETLIKVRQTELDVEKRPKNPHASAGRFLMRTAAFLDPAIYKEGREITVAGELAGKMILPLGDTQYSYPLISAREIHLWEKREAVYPGYPWYWYDPFWHPYGYPYRWYRPYW